MRLRTEVSHLAEGGPPVRPFPERIIPRQGIQTTEAFESEGLHLPDESRLEAEFQPQPADLLDAPSQLPEDVRVGPVAGLAGRRAESGQDLSDVALHGDFPGGVGRARRGIARTDLQGCYDADRPDGR